MERLVHHMPYVHQRQPYGRALSTPLRGHITLHPSSEYTLLCCQYLHLYLSSVIGISHPPQTIAMTSRASVVAAVFKQTRWRWIEHARTHAIPLTLTSLFISAVANPALFFPPPYPSPLTLAIARSNLHPHLNPSINQLNLQSVNQKNTVKMPIRWNSQTDVKVCSLLRFCSFLFPAVRLCVRIQVALALLDRCQEERYRRSFIFQFRFCSWLPLSLAVVFLLLLC
jgi:hypothetical protein